MGYGDAYPTTKCGRVVAIVTAVLGVVFSALGIALLTSVLSLTTTERRVLHVLTKSNLIQQRKRVPLQLLFVSLTWWLQTANDGVGWLLCLILVTFLSLSARRWPLLRSSGGGGCTFCGGASVATATKASNRRSTRPRYGAPETKGKEGGCGVVIGRWVGQGGCQVLLCFHR